MQDLNIIQNLVVWLGSGVVILSILIYLWGRGERRIPSWRAGDIWVLLVLELLIFASVGAVIAVLKTPKELADYLSFAAPCVAGIVVGIGLVRRADKELMAMPKDNDIAWDYRAYLGSAALLFGALIAYLGAHFDALVISVAAVVFVVLCVIAYFVSFNAQERDWWEGSGKTFPAIIGACLVLLCIAFTLFVYAHGLELPRS